MSGADKNLWFTESAANRISRITPAGAITEFAIPTAGSSPAGLVSAADGNIWFAESAGNRVARILTGVVAVATTVPAITGTSTNVGQQLTASTGAWSGLPSTYGYQWQRCATADVSSCSSIAGATNAAYTITTDDASKRLRVQVVATNLNGASTAASSALLVIDGLPPAPVPRPSPVDRR